MKARGMWTFRSFFTCFFWNAAMVAILYYLANDILLGLNKWVTPFLQPEAANLPDDVRSALTGLGRYLSEIQHFLATTIFGLGALITFVLWLSILIQGHIYAARVMEASSISPAPPAEKPKEAKKPEKKAPEPQAPETHTQPSPHSAVQMLSILQREGRLIDFLQEDLSLYDDAQIGAAVRNIHQGCKDALREHVELKPVFEEGEGSAITVAAGFDSRAVRLTGNVTGDPPFKGILRHRGWKATRVELPLPLSEQKKEKEWIVAPAEVEIGE